MKNLRNLLSNKDIDLLTSTIDDNLALANTLIEKAVGYFKLPFALTSGIKINSKFYPYIPLVTEETSVVAALSKNIAFLRANSTIIASQTGFCCIGQIHFPHLLSPQLFEQKISLMKQKLIDQANQNPCISMAKRGGGVKDIHVRMMKISDCRTMGIVHVMLDSKDAMGANLINQTCEYLKPFIEEITTEKSLISILSNLNTEKLTSIELFIENIDEDLAYNIQEASLIAQYDHYRAVTHNKGILNGMDAVCIATGNDWRALEAGMHGFASHKGHYQGLSKWVSNGRQLKGTLIGPINVGIVGGMTKIHPLADFSLRCLEVENSYELAYVIGAVGLIQNFAALRALVTGGISSGHMRLHLKNLIKQTDATSDEQENLIKILKKVFFEKKYITATDAHEILKKLRL